MLPSTFESTKNGILSKWSPQQTILAHPVTGWFLSHCGQNGLIETIAAGVPLICWPFTSDQGTNAAHATINLGIGYELFEVRTGFGLQPIHRLGRAPIATVEAVKEEAAVVLGQAFSEDGEKKRANAKALQKTLLNAWSEGGASSQDLQALSDSIFA